MEPTIFIKFTADIGLTLTLPFHGTIHPLSLSKLTYYPDTRIFFPIAIFPELF